MTAAGIGTRHMPTMGRIVDYWRDHAEAWLLAHYIGWGEPFCFACSWLPPVDSWSAASAWLDRAHLQDRANGGPDDAANLVPLCHLCHLDMPEFPDSRADALAWVIDRPRRDPAFQVFTDAMPRRTPTRPTTLLRARAEYLGAVLELGQERAA